MEPRLTHIALLVSNVDKTADFYIKYCNLKVVHRRVDPDTGYRVIWLGKDLNFVIVAMESNRMPIQSKAKPLSHLGFALNSKDEVDAIANVAQEEGLLNYGPTFLDAVAGYLCEILDPDGNSIEFSYGQELGKDKLL